MKKVTKKSKTEELQIAHNETIHYYKTNMGLAISWEGNKKMRVFGLSSLFFLNIKV